MREGIVFGLYFWPVSFLIDLDLICDPGTKGLSAGLVFTEGGYHLLLELFEWSHSWIFFFEVVLLLKNPEEIRGVITVSLFT